MQGEKSRAELEKSSTSSEKDLLLQELDKQEQIEKLQKRLDGVGTKSKADIRILVKEVKFLRSSQAELKEMLNQSLQEKTELEVKYYVFLKWIHWSLCGYVLVKAKDAKAIFCVIEFDWDSKNFLAL